MFLRTKEEILLDEAVRGGNRFIAWFAGHANQRKIERDIEDKLKDIRSEDDRRRVLRDLEKLEDALEASSSLGGILFKVFIFGGVLSLIFTMANKLDGNTDDVLDIVQTLKSKVREYKIPK